MERMLLSVVLLKRRVVLSWWIGIRKIIKNSPACIRGCLVCTTLSPSCQVTAQKNQWELDKLVTWTDVTKKATVEEVEGNSRDGAYMHGLAPDGM